jgi:Mn-dependent DtxR family transcriptional regulator
MDQNLLAAALLALFDLARDGQPAHMGNVADRIGASRKDAVMALKELERRGLCDAARTRLTMKGLVVVASARKAPKQAKRSRAA